MLENFKVKTPANNLLYQQLHADTVEIGSIVGREMLIGEHLAWLEAMGWRLDVVLELISTYGRLKEQLQRNCA